MAADRLIGCLQLSGEAQPLPDALIRRVETFAAQAAITIENAHLYKTVQDYARSLQMATWEKEQLLEQVQRYAETLEQEVASRTAQIFAEKEKVEAILKSAGDAIVITNAQGCISFVNKAFTALTGYLSEEVMGQSATEVLPSHQTPPATLTNVQRAVTHGILWRGDVAIGHKDGYTIETDITLAPVRNETGQLINSVASLRDVSQTRALERAKSTFLTNVSHQLRTPVTSLRTYSYLLSKGSPEKHARYTEIVQSEVERLLRLVQDLLEIVELDAGPVVTDWHSVSPTELVKMAVTHHQSQAEAAGLALMAVTPGEPLPSVLGCKQRLAQALNKLVENAVCFTETGEVIVGARLANPSSVDPNQVTLWVSDTGPGIAREEQGFLFDRFFRGEAARPGHIRGTGLGLSTALMIVEAHGGRIEVHSELGQGSTFEVWLPVSA
jgi:PAS domain S-box-containing protein